MKRQNIVIGTIVVLLCIFGFASSRWKAKRAQEVATLAREHSQLFEPAHAMRMGEPTAKVTIVEFFDPACETCGQFAPVLKGMVDNNPGRVQLVERYAPFHPGSEAVVVLLEASRRQDRYWQTLDILFKTQSAWTANHTAQVDLVWNFLQQGGIDVTRLADDAKDPAIKALIAQDLQDAKALGVTQTPEFFVNGKPLPTWGLQQLQDLVKSELAANY